MLDFTKIQTCKNAVKSGVIIEKKREKMVKKTQKKHTLKKAVQPVGALRRSLFFTTFRECIFSVYSFHVFLQKNCVFGVGFI